MKSSNNSNRPHLPVTYYQALALLSNPVPVTSSHSHSHPGRHDQWFRYLLLTQIAYSLTHLTGRTNWAEDTFPYEEDLTRRKWAKRTGMPRHCSCQVGKGEPQVPL
ncbi:hypothetical protein BaRGS_00039071 [Batillaria attramentaria]|uniref:Uncharacterized protein n=1 Tax=Batillaria attramentaria TaxID=370345 RepID=A0ABD0J448_9CAEN